MTLEPCAGCGRHVLIQKIANLTVKCDPTPLTDVGEIVRLLTSPNPPGMWMVDSGKLRPARPGELGPVREHRCTVNAQEALSRLRTPSKVSTPQPTPHEPSAGQQTPFSGPSAANSSARSAGPARSDGPRCSACSKPCADGTYASIEVGELVIWAQHLTDCEG